MQRGIYDVEEKRPGSCGDPNSAGYNNPVFSFKRQPEMGRRHIALGNHAAGRRSQLARYGRRDDPAQGLLGWRFHWIWSELSSSLSPPFV